MTATDDGRSEGCFRWCPITHAPKSNPTEEHAWIVRRTDQLLAEEIDTGIPVERLARVLAVPISVVKERADRHRRRQKVGVVVNISERCTLVLHRMLAGHLDAAALAAWTPRILANLDRLGARVHGRPHEANLARWREIVTAGDVEAMRMVLTAESRDGIEMREVSPMSGIIDQDERAAALRSVATEGQGA